MDRKLRWILQYTSLPIISTCQQFTLGVFFISPLPHFLAQSSGDQIIPAEDNRFFRFCLTLGQIAIDIPVVLVGHTGGGNGRGIVSGMRNDLCCHRSIYVTS